MTQNPQQPGDTLAHTHDPSIDTQTTQTSTTTPENAQYQCPYCHTTYPNEGLTRVHITRAEGTLHSNKDGFAPETTINIVTEDNTLIDTITQTGTKADPTELTIADIPDDIDARHRHVLLVGAHYPETDTYTELSEKANTILNEQGFEQLSYSTVRRVLRDFYRPDPETNKTTNQTPTTETDTTDEQDALLSDLTTTKQAIIIAHAAHPEESKTQIADRVGASVSYPTQVLDKHEDVVDGIAEHQADTETTEEAIGKALTTSDFQQLYAEEKFADIEVDAQAVREAIPTTQQPTTGTEPTTEKVYGVDEVREPTTQYHVQKGDAQTVDGKSMDDCVPKEDVEEIQEQAEMYTTMLTVNDDVENDPEVFIHALEQLNDSLLSLTDDE